MAIDLATLAALGVIPPALVGAMGAPLIPGQQGAPQQMVTPNTQPAPVAPGLGASAYPVGANGVDPLAALTSPNAAVDQANSAPAAPDPTSGISATPDLSDLPSASALQSLLTSTPTDTTATDNSSKYATAASNGSGFGQPWRSSALLALGAGLLSGKNFFQGLAQGSLAAEQAKQSYVNPQRQLVENGAFTLQQYPDGTTRLVPNPAVQGYQRSLAVGSILGKLLEAQNAGNIAAKRTAALIAANAANVQARVGAEEKDTAARIASNEKLTTTRLNLQAQAGQFETPYQKEMDKAQAQEDQNLPTAISSTQSIKNQLLELRQLAQDPSSGIGPGVILKGQRALALASGKSVGGIDINKLQRADQIIKGIRMAFNKQMWKGMGARVSNYEVKMLNAAQPNLELGSGPMLQRIDDMLATTNDTLNYLGLESQRAASRAYHGEAQPQIQPTPGGVTSGGLHWSIAGQ